MTKAAQIREMLEKHPDMHYKDVARKVGCAALYVSQIRSGMKYGYLYRPREPGGYVGIEPTKTVVSDWFIDRDGLRTRLIKGVAA